MNTKQVVAALLPIVCPLTCEVAVPCPVVTFPANRRLKLTEAVFEMSVTSDTTTRRSRWRHTRSSVVFYRRRHRHRHHV